VPRTYKNAYFRHKFKCLSCGLHFTVFSWRAHWFAGVTKRENPSKFLQCVGCGSRGAIAYWRERVQGEIRDDVPGKAKLTSMFCLLGRGGRR
jgi:hypothetical protein